MTARTHRIMAVIMAVSVLFVATISLAANAELSTPPLPPTLHAPTGTPAPEPTPEPSEKTSGGSSGGSSATASISGFQPYTVDLRSTDGSLIGYVTATAYDSAKLWAERSVQIGNINYTVRLTADLDTMPMMPQLDILPVSSDIGQPLLLDMHRSIGAFNITRYSKGNPWTIRPDTARLYITAPAEALNGIDTGATIYLIKNNTQGRIVYEAISANTTGSTTTFEILLSYESQATSNTGIYDLVGKNMPAAELTGTTASLVRDTTVEPVNTKDSNVLPLAGTLIAGIVIGLTTMLLFANRLRR